MTYFSFGSQGKWAGKVIAEAKRLTYLKLWSWMLLLGMTKLSV